VVEERKRESRLLQQQRRRVAVLFTLVLAATLVAAIEPLHHAARSAVAAADPVIRQHVVAGAVLFVILSALSAMVVFFSTAVITPIAVDAFGPAVTLVLLWLGWILGGLTAYAIGRLFGHGMVALFVDPRRLAEYEGRAARLVTLRHVLVFQLAVPSEIPGYVLGLAGCRFRTFAAAMALGELPFAIGAVYLGESFLERNYALLLAIGAGGIALSWATFRRASKLWSPDGETRDRRPVRRVADEAEADLRSRAVVQRHVHGGVGAGIRELEPHVADVRDPLTGVRAAGLHHDVAVLGVDTAQRPDDDFFVRVHAHSDQRPGVVPREAGEESVPVRACNGAELHLIHTT